MFQFTRKPPKVCITCSSQKLNYYSIRNIVCSFFTNYLNSSSLVSIKIINPYTIFFCINYLIYYIF